MICASGLVLRPLEMADAEEHAAGNDEEMRRAFEALAVATVEETQRWITRCRASWADDGPARNFGVWRDPGGQLVANVEVRDLGAGCVNLSYAVFPAWRRRGIAAAAARAALEYAVDEWGAAAAVVKALVDNRGSQGVARRLGLFHLDLPPDDHRSA